MLLFYRRLWLTSENEARRVQKAVDNKMIFKNHLLQADFYLENIYFCGPLTGNGKDMVETSISSSEGT